MTSIPRRPKLKYQSCSCSPCLKTRCGTGPRELPEPAKSLFAPIAKTAGSISAWRTTDHRTLFPQMCPRMVLDLAIRTRACDSTTARTSRLDIQMPDLSGFDVIAKVGVEEMPAFVFVTAYNEFAVRAFEVEAVDYLCKPFDQDRVAASLERAMRRFRLRNDNTTSENELSASKDKTARWLSRIPIKEKS